MKGLTNMTNEELREIKRLNFEVIPIVSLGGRYLINKECNIIDSQKDYSDCAIYLWDALTALKPIELILKNGELIMIPPARLFMITYYGYFEAEIYDMGCGLPITRYKYIVNVKEKSFNNTLVLNNDTFKYSTKYNVYVNQYGCVYHNFALLRHSITNKKYHMVYSKNVRCLIHRVVYDAWVGIKDMNNDIHHIDGNNWNNYYKNLQEITPEEHKKIANNNYIYSDEIVYKVCELMSKGMRPADAAKEVGIPAEAAVRYRNGSRPEISSKFTYPKLSGFKLAKLDDSKVKEICNLFETSKLSNKEIADMYSVDKYTVQDIRNRITWRDISKDYNFESKDPTVRERKSQIGNRRNASITEEEVILIYKLLKEGHKICEVRDMTGISYSIIKKIKYKTRWASVTDKLDAELENEHNEGSTTIESIA